MTYSANRFFVAYGQKYRNLWRAYDALGTTEHDVEPYVENDTFKNLKGTKVDVDRDYESDCVQMLFDRYKNINLLYSGGTDSHTIYEKAKQLGYKFEQTLMVGQSIHPETGIDTNHITPEIKEYFKDDKGFCFHPSSLEWYEKTFLNSEWWYNDWEFDLAPITKLSYISAFDQNQLYLAGMDKPWLLYHDRNWYLYYNHVQLGRAWDRPNVFYFFGLNDLLPELAIQQALRARNFYINKFDVPQNTQFIDYKMHQYSANSKDFIVDFNRALGRISINKNHDMDQSFDNPVLSKRGIWRLHQLYQEGRGDIASSFLRQCMNIYNKYSQIDWTYAPYSPMGRIPWIINIDTLEYIHGNEVANMTQ